MHGNAIQLYYWLNVTNLSKMKQNANQNSV